VSFDPGINTTIEHRLSTGSYVDPAACCFIPGILVSMPEHRLSTGSYVDPAACCFIPGILVPIPEHRLGGYLQFLPPTLITNGGKKVFMSALPVLVGDDSVEIVFGIRVDFTASPRIGRTPLTVQFTQLCCGVITEYYWLFGDGRRSFYSDPSHIYLPVGTYDVTLRIRAEGIYFSLKKKKYITVLPGGLVVSRTTRFLRHAILPEQGIGFYEMPAAGIMPMPEAGVGVLSLYDANNQVRGLVLDAETGLWYDVTTRDGPEGSGLSRIETDKNAAQFDRTVKFPQDRGTDETDFERLVESHLFIRPLKESNRSQAGFDANGYPDGMKINLDFYKDGEPTTPTATITNIPLNGDLKTDRKVEGNGIQMGVTINRGSHYILNRLNKYVSSRRAASPEKRIMNEMTWQEELAQAVLWMSYSNGTLKNRVTGKELSLTGITAAAGPEGTAGTAQQFSTEQTLPSVNISSGSILLWMYGTLAVSIAGTAISLSDLGTVGSFTLKYASGITKNGAVKLTPTGTVVVADLRAFNAAISSDALDYYKSDVENNSGGIVLP
jgi:PKD repeat protein